MEEGNLGDASAFASQARARQGPAGAGDCGWAQAHSPRVDLTVDAGCPCGSPIIHHLTLMTTADCPRCGRTLAIGRFHYYRSSPRPSGRPSVGWVESEESLRVSAYAKASIETLLPILCVEAVFVRWNAQTQVWDWTYRCRRCHRFRLCLPRLTALQVVVSLIESMTYRKVANRPDHMQSMRRASRDSAVD